MCESGRSLLPWVITLAAAACGGEPAPAPRVPVGHIPEAPGWPGWPGSNRPGRAVPAIDFRGTCVWGRSAGAAGRYRVRLRVIAGADHAVPVRADAHFDPGDDDNIIGELPAGTLVWADGPVASGRGIGYAIPVRGHTGRVCRGYVSASAVERAPDPAQP
ncbi:hypothetical protein [Haliangium sp.]|uniref:hypothetical protein n=1 Tax=Haliangium sp. TaxID=2663208 RepID=UPI003D0968F5